MKNGQFYTKCTKDRIVSKKIYRNEKNDEKVIHIEKCGNIEKKELYTEL